MATYFVTIEGTDRIGRKQTETFKWNNVDNAIWCVQHFGRVEMDGRWTIIDGEVCEVDKVTLYEGKPIIL